MPEKCSRCGSDKMMDDVHLNTRSPNLYPPHQLVAFVHKEPDAWILKGTVFGTLRARICGGCGHTEIYTENFQQLYEAYQQSQGG
jgi:hypothetical protein